MADSSATPGLYKLPPELLSTIGSFSDLPGLKAISRASKRCRGLFAPKLFGEVRFEGIPVSLSHTLDNFIVSQRDAPVVRVRNHIR